MATRSILVNFRNYTGFGSEFYEPLLDFFIQQMAKYQDEFDMLYLLDSQFDIGSVKESWGISKVKIIKVNPSLTYSDAYKSVLKDVEEDLVLLLDNDTVIYKEGIIRGAFLKLEASLNNADTYDVVSIFDTIGTFKTDKMGGKNKLCPYFFATRRELLMKYLDIDWNSHMPHSETLGLLTEAMLNDNLKIWEFPEDKSNILFDGTQEGEHSLDTGVYHVRGGSTIPYLLASKFDTPEHNQQYQDYLKNQPKSEILRHAMWYLYMCSDPFNKVQLEINDLVADLGVNSKEWLEYSLAFKEYHSLI